MRAPLLPASCLPCEAAAAAATAAVDAATHAVDAATAIVDVNQFSVSHFPRERQVPSRIRRRSRRRLRAATANLAQGGTAPLPSQLALVFAQLLARRVTLAAQPLHVAPRRLQLH